MDPLIDSEPWKKGSARRPAADIARVTPGGLAQKAGIEPGHRLLRVNGQPVRDIIDYKLQVSEPLVVLDLERQDGTPYQVRLEKSPDADLGLEFRSAVFDGIRRCANHCQFCFVDQMPPGMRPTLYVKDDDFRLSFWHGSFITLTNLTERDYARIFQQRLSPLFVSVHATDGQTRVRLMRNPRAADILSALHRLVEGGIQVHCQVVLVPGFNDGKQLERTVEDLAGMVPGVASIALVPVGLTSHRQGLPPLRRFRPAECRDIIRMVRRWQKEFRRRLGTRLVYAADEFYLCAGETPPGVVSYEGYPQLENGVGMVRRFWAQASLATRDIAARQPPRHWVVLTGRLGAEVLEPVVSRLRDVQGLVVEVHAVENRLFGPEVTCTGLLGGADLLADWETRWGRGGQRPADGVLLPAVLFQSGGGVTLDGMTPADLARAMGVPVYVLPVHGGILVETLLGRSGGRDGMPAGVQRFDAPLGHAHPDADPPKVGEEMGINIG